MSKTPFDTAPEGKLLKRTERNKIVGMSVAAALVVFAVLFSQLQGKGRADRELDQIPGDEEEAFVEQIVVPVFDESVISGKVLDARDGDRVLLQRKTLDPLLEYTNGFRSAHFLALNIEPLNAETAAALSADPEAHRAAPYFVRGWIETVSQRVGAEGETEFHGRLLLEDSGFAHFVTRSMPASAIVGDFVRFDGLFLKLLRTEGEEGWVEGPLLVGPKLIKSWPRPKEVDREALFRELAQITDDSLNGGITGLGAEPYNAQWLLMDKILRLGDDEVDWDTAPELNDATLVAIMTRGAEWRGTPVRVPISRSMDLWTKAPGENPARAEVTTLGWIGSWTWVNNKSAVIHYIMPFGLDHLRGSELVTGHGYFIKNFAYETRDGDLRVAPFFVLSHLEEFVPPPDLTGMYIGGGLLVLTVLMILFIVIGLHRDKKRAAEFQANMVRRRRARRERATSSESG